MLMRFTSCVVGDFLVNMKNSKFDGRSICFISYANAKDYTSHGPQSCTMLQNTGRFDESIYRMYVFAIILYQSERVEKRERRLGMNLSLINDNIYYYLLLVSCAFNVSLCYYLSYFSAICGRTAVKFSSRYMTLELADSNESEK